MDAIEPMPKEMTVATPGEMPDPIEESMPFWPVAFLAPKLLVAASAAESGAAASDARSLAASRGRAHMERVRCRAHRKFRCRDFLRHE